MKKLITSWLKQSRRHSDSVESLKSEIDILKARLDARRKAYDGLSARRALLTEIATNVANHMEPGSHHEIYGPFGIGGTYSVEWRTKKGRALVCADFRFGDDGPRFVTDVVEHMYPPGSIGQMNGLGTKCIPLSSLTYANLTSLILRDKE
jgi:hypothetical protein